MAQWLDHPGTITNVDLFDGTSVEVPASEVPEAQRFVYAANGVGTEDRERATERFPVVRVETLPTDGRGNIVPKGAARIHRVTELGPGGRLLRSSIRMRRTP